MTEEEKNKLYEICKKFMSDKKNVAFLIRIIIQQDWKINVYPFIDDKRDLWKLKKIQFSNGSLGRVFLVVRIPEFLWDYIENRKRKSESCSL